MFDEIRYRWALRKYLKGYKLAHQSYKLVPDEPDAEGTNFPKYIAGKAVNFQTHMMVNFGRIISSSRPAGITYLSPIMKMTGIYTHMPPKTMSAT